MQRIIIFLSIFLFIVSSVYGQNATATISGFVYEDSNGEALIGANVFLEGTQIGASTNQNGYYVIPRAPAVVHR